MKNKYLTRFKFKFNCLNVNKHISSYLYGLRSYEDIKPLRLLIHPSGKCNDSCKYCKRNTDPKIEPDFFGNRDYIDKLARDVEELGIKDIHMLGGGEPFFYKDNMFYFLERLRNVDTHTRIITNGKNLNDSDISSIVKDELVSNLNITQSTDSEEMAGKLYQNKERHTHTISLLGNILKYKKLYNKKFPQIDIMFVLSNLNYNKIDKIISMLKELKVNYFFMQPLRIDCDDYKELDLSEEQKKEFLVKIPETKRLLQKANIVSNINDFEVNDDFITDSRDYKSVIPDTILTGRHLKIGCYFPLTTIAIHHDGIIPKCYFNKPLFDRNYFSISSLKEEIRSAGYLDFVKNFVGGNCLSSCDGCRICILNEMREIKKDFINFKKKNDILVNCP